MRWQSLEADEIGFRQSAEYQEWKRLLHHFYDPFPVVSHYRAVAGAGQVEEPETAREQAGAGGDAPVR